MDHRNFAHHCLTQPVETLEQARAVLASQDAWAILGEGLPASRWELERVAVLPGTAALLQQGKSLRQTADVRLMEAVAWVIEDEKRRWAQFPELGLSPLVDLVGVKVSYFNNGPDNPPTMALSMPQYSGEATAAHNKAFSLLRAHWSQMEPSSPLRAVMRILANRDPHEWVADLTSKKAVVESLMGPDEFAQYMSRHLETHLPASSATPSRRARM